MIKYAEPITNIFHILIYNFLKRILCLTSVVHDQSEKTTQMHTNQNVIVIIVPNLTFCILN